MNSELAENYERIGEKWYFEWFSGFGASELTIKFDTIKKCQTKVEINI